MCWNYKHLKLTASHWVSHSLTLHESIIEPTLRAGLELLTRTGTVWGLPERHKRLPKRLKIFAYKAQKLSLCIIKVNTGINNLHEKFNFIFCYGIRYIMVSTLKCWPLKFYLHHFPLSNLKKFYIFWISKARGTFWQGASVDCWFLPFIRIALTCRPDDNVARNVVLVWSQAKVT